MQRISSRNPKSSVLNVKNWWKSIKKNSAKWNSPNFGAFIKLLQLHTSVKKISQLKEDNVLTMPCKDVIILVMVKTRKIGCLKRILKACHHLILSLIEVSALRNAKKSSATKISAMSNKTGLVSTRFILCVYRNVKIS